MATKLPPLAYCSPEASSLPLLPQSATTPLPPASPSSAALLLPENSCISVLPLSKPSPLSKALSLQLLQLTFTLQISLLLAVLLFRSSPPLKAPPLQQLQAISTPPTSWRSAPPLSRTQLHQPSLSPALQLLPASSWQ